MVKTYADFLFAEINTRGLIGFFVDDSLQNKLILDNILSEMNITKCTLKDVEIQESGTTLLLEYLLQSEKKIPFGICSSFKMWRNSKGYQYGCVLDKGAGKHIQIRCLGSKNLCNRIKHSEGYEAK